MGALTEATQSTAAGDADAVTMTTNDAVQPAAAALELLTDNYVTLIIVISIVVLLVVGVVAYKTYTTWMTTKTSRRRRHDSGHWLTEDNPEMWDDETPYGELQLTRVQRET